MAEAATKVPLEVKKAERPAPVPAEWHPFETLRREIDHLFDDFGVGRWRSPLRARSSETEPFWRTEISWSKAPAVDVAETDKAYEVTAELPGMDESNIEVKLADDLLTIKGEKKEEKEERKKDYYVSERRIRLVPALLYGAGRRRCQQDRGEFQERRPHRHIAEECAGAEERKENRDQEGGLGRKPLLLLQPRSQTNCPVLSTGHFDLSPVRPHIANMLSYAECG